MVKDKNNKWAKDKLKEMISKEITDMFTSILDYAEIALGDKDRFMALRSKVLRVGNDAIRRIRSDIDNKYNAEYLGLGEDILKIQSK